MTQPYITLNNGIAMPQLGLGVWQTKDGQEVETAVSAALDTGYRLIDTAAIYGNEQGVGRAVAASGIPREELFITTKVWNADQGYNSTLAAFEKSLERLQLDYIDLYLIHWPMPAVGKYIDTWHALEKLYADKKVRAIGVSNFTPEYLEHLLNESTIVPAVNQIELHPYLSQSETRDYCKQIGIAIESYSPLGSARSDLLDNKALQDIAERCNKTVAQVILRWHLQHGFIVIPKSVHPDRIAQNYAIFDFELSNDDMTLIDSLNTDTRVGANPTTANFT